MAVAAAGGDTMRRGLIRRLVLATAPGPLVARGLELVCYGAVIAALAATCWAIFLIADSLVADAVVRGGVIFLVIGAGAALVSLVGRFAELYGQRARDIEADRIFSAVRAGGTAPLYTLYLRPFASTDSIEDYSTAVMMPGLGITFGGERFELEAQVERATRRIGRLIGLGAPVEHVGAGRVTVGEGEWREAIHALMNGARLIVILPSSRAGTLEEVSMVLGSDLVRKTVFLDPPNVGSRERFDHVREWSKVQAAFAEKGFELPKEDRRGRLLFFGDAKTPVFGERLHIEAEDRIERLFGRVARELAKAHA